MHILRNEEGTNIIELLVAIGLFAIITAIVLVAVNPKAQYIKIKQNRNTAELAAVVNAINQYTLDNGDTLPVSVGNANVYPIGRPGIEISTAGMNICAALVPQYIGFLPSNPFTTAGKQVTDCSQPYTTGFYIYRRSNSNDVTITSTP